MVVTQWYDTDTEDPTWVSIISEVHGECDARHEELELIPHSDTVKLDWLQSNVLVFSGEKIAIINDGLDFYLTDNPEKPELENPMKTLRQAIENAMQQEQEK
ncbi:hypothetical protein [Wielerella bovis]|uniref:hypothetical protein n=1 Tax=Wielerella bovis TaxID=2917790 RepID=UPI002019474F|nr:hypothetical protein [Wielerella bovis]ULJ64013.1 hypothetical protein MIS33_07535 [Wielerella bovis]ULJ67527.1 hypothetical protein MIS31_02925 [Wielerella bovis]